MSKLVLAENLHQFKFFVRHFNLNRKDYRYVYDWSDMCGYWIDTPVIMLEQWHYNKNYTLELMNLMGYRFENIAFLSEGEMWNEGLVIGPQRKFQ